MTGRRIVSISLPRLAIESWQSRAAHRGDAWPEDIPLALAAPGPHGPVIHATNRAAEAAGTRIGARVVDSRAICPALRIEPAELEQDAARLARLAFWTRRWGPYSTPDGDDGIVLDTSGAAHLFGGEAAMLAQIQAGFARAGLTAGLALAPTRGAAWALARLGPERATLHRSLAGAGAAAGRRAAAVGGKPCCSCAGWGSGPSATWPRFRACR
ncbi:Y-family DNA polymerase [Paracoccus thiocyanatus]|uniref:Y-family DNA polymerase n=1 Tax=Paracoccus thiocyanatus TaxID=34006 RepID=UPI00216112A5|nr:DNA polymerase Y family protein [Paracoccus thiocyanatus]